MWTKERQDKFIELAKAGVMFKEIAEIIGVTEEDVIERIRKAGVRKTKPPKLVFVPKPKVVMKAIAKKKPLPKSLFTKVKEDKAYAAIKRVQKYTDIKCFAEEPKDTDLTLLQLTPRSCRWPVRDGFYCGLHTEDTYCAKHATIDTIGYQKYLEITLKALIQSHPSLS